MDAKTIAAFHSIEPEKFGLKEIADFAWKEACEIYNRQYQLVTEGIREKPDQGQVTKAFAFAKLAQLADIASKDKDGFWNALRRVRAGGRF